MLSDDDLDRMEHHARHGDGIHRMATDALRLVAEIRAFRAEVAGLRANGYDREGWNGGYEAGYRRCTADVLAWLTPFRGTDLWPGSAADAIARGEHEGAADAE